MAKPNAVWLIHEARYRVFFEALAGKEISLEDFFIARPAASVDERGIASIAVQGPLLNGLSPFESRIGMTSYPLLDKEIDDVLDMGAQGILFEVNSPGGMANGCPELSERIAQLAVPTVTYTGEINASAAYSLSVSTDYIMAGASAEVGSIGAILPLADVSKMLEMEGIKVFCLTNEGADLKDAYAPPSYTEEHLGYLQEMVNEVGAAFKAHVGNHRLVEAGAMRGQTLLGPRALEANLIDAVGTRADAYDQLAGVLEGRGRPAG